MDILPEYREKLLAYGWAWTVLAPVVPFVALYDSLAAIFRRQIKWRGSRYRLISPQETRVLPH
jgi:hypothetical protein